ncbi:hypothetical protein HOY80DRAFT_1006429 [Tuber brumale]|nr:hypothetical protein HOY80DRAFT_1006429 [Tuber brumale]
MKELVNRWSYHTEEDAFGQQKQNITVTSNLVRPTHTEFRTLEAYMTVQGDQAKALFETENMGDHLICNTFVTTFHIPTKTLDILINLKMAVKGSGATINHSSKQVM